MEPAPEKVPSVDTPASDTLFQGHTWGWDGIDCRAVVAQNKNEPSFKIGWIPQSLSYIDTFLHCIPLEYLRILLLPSTSRAMKESGIAPLKLGDILGYLGQWILMSTFG